MAYPQLGGGDDAGAAGPMLAARFVSVLTPGGAGSAGSCWACSGVYWRSCWLSCR
ncbi:Uncharacterised protein [Mycobacteroides abscessus subsp. abscessus]|nr:Uncharacterised protein [Mycobacteroides abscessus subsp. abscessus]SKT86538.1 Uncharacterised protein [Mycobacteroides abscessus subsp. abscessus]SKW80473.1 Uncharacterised protein [Mycobacteroides abscessus subsp. abscessus]